MATEQFGTLLHKKTPVRAWVKWCHTNHYILEKNLEQDGEIFSASPWLWKATFSSGISTLFPNSPLLITLSRNAGWVK